MSGRDIAVPPWVARPVAPEGGDRTEEFVRQLLRFWFELQATLSQRDLDRTRPVFDNIFGEGGLVFAPPERSRHDPVERVETPIADDDGAVAQPFIAIDWLERMRRRDRIKRVEYDAGCRFRNDFRVAQLSNLRAADAGRLPGNGRPAGVSYTAMEAGDRAWEALKALGGPMSAAGSAAWCCLGEEMTIKDWAQHRGVRESMGSGIVVGMLCALEAHYLELDNRERRGRR